MQQKEKGYVHIYTGNGKGKTTACFGLAVRAAIAGKKVYIMQFVKSMVYNEAQVGKYIDNITVEQCGDGCFVRRDPNTKDIALAEEGFKKIEEILTGDKYDLVIMDEINIAIHFQLLSVDRVLHALKNRNPKIEVVLSGRYAKDEIIEYADLVTEMKEIKHYYKQGLMARDGIER